MYGDQVLECGHVVVGGGGINQPTTGSKDKFEYFTFVLSWGYL